MGIFYWMISIIFILGFSFLGLWTIWLFQEWRLLENILEKFQEQKAWEQRFQEQKETYQKNQHSKSKYQENSIFMLENKKNVSFFSKRKYRKLLFADLQETRESKLISQMEQILNRASFKEKQAQKEKNQIMGLISDLSHQLKTPLANIILDTELLESNEMKEEQRKEFLCHVRTQASRMQWLLKSLLKASRLEHGMIQFQAENIKIKATIAKAVSAVYAQAKNKKIEIFMEEFKDRTLFHNAKWTAEAMINVLENAVKYSPEKSKIKISITEMDIYTRITVSDQGQGIQKTEYNKIFQRFYRGKQAEAEEGTGLGLYLSQLILQNEQGYLTVDSKLGKGSRFHFFLLNNSLQASSANVL